MIEMMVYEYTSMHTGAFTVPGNLPWYMYM